MKDIRCIHEYKERKEKRMAAIFIIIRWDEEGFQLIFLLHIGILQSLMIKIHILLLFYCLNICMHQMNKTK